MEQAKTIVVEHNPSDARLEELGARSWPIWTKEISRFDYEYDSEETCLFLEGDVVVTPKGGAPVTMGQGDLVIFPQGMVCVWEIRKPVRKHYQFA